MKIIRKKAIELATSLFEMETEMIGNDPQGCFAVRDWFDKYGEDCDKFENKLTSDDKAIEDIATEIQKDFASGYWKPDSDGLYNYMMPTIYGGYIDEALEKQLAVLTGVGYQSELNFA